MFEQFAALREGFVLEFQETVDQGFHGMSSWQK
jgi:hypothetical protein